MPDCRIGKEIKGPNLWFGLLLLPYIKLIMRFFASFQISSGHASLNFAFRALTSSIFAWSQSITPVVCVRPSVCFFLLCCKNQSFS